MANFFDRIGDAVFGRPASSSSGVANIQKPYLQDLYGNAQTAYDRGQLGQVAQFNPYQTSGFNQALGFANNFGSMYGNVSNALSGLLSGNVNLDAYNPIANQITNQFGRAFNESVIPGIRRGNLSASGRPTSRAGIATTQAADRFGQGLGNALNNLYLPAYQQAQNQIGTGLGLAGQVANLGLLPSSIYQDIGGQYQNLGQQNLDSPYNALSQYSSLIGQPIINSNQRGGTGGLLSGINLGFNL